ncbi:IS1595 family transposase [Chloroflexota bacterium]
MKKYTIKDFEKQFPTDDACLEFLFNARYPEGVHCQKCDKVTPHYKIANRKVYSCQFCGVHISPTADTIFHKSATPLRSWFHAIFLMASTKTGISAKQLERELGVTYKTAWRIFKEVRKLMAEDVNPLTGHVEVDETYVGGKRQGKRGRGASGKTIVMGMTEREGNAITKVVPNVKAMTLLPMIWKNVSNNSTIFTDELPSYNQVAKLGYAHRIVQHSAKQYVSGVAHVNTIESLWSTIKRGIDGVNHSVSPLYLQSYLDSYVYRYNHRKDETPMFQSLLNRVALVVKPS